MVTFGMASIGLSVRNVTEPTFGEGADALVLKRQAQGGFCAEHGPARRIGTGAVAVDADLTTTVTAAGEQRRVAVGGEIWTTRRVLGLRGGVSRNRVGERRNVAERRGQRSVSTAEKSDIVRGWAGDGRIG